MFCARCDIFISNWSKTLTTDEHGNVHFIAYTECLHSSISNLQESSEEGCTICRNAWYILLGREQNSLSDESSCDLEVMPDAGRPMLRAIFKSPDRPPIARMLAMFLRESTNDAESRILDDLSTMDCSSTGQESSFKLARFWLERCLRDHTECPKPGGFFPTRVLDVLSDDDLSIVKVVESSTFTKADGSLPYVALSHCWGRERFLTTTTDNLEDHKHSIPMAALPKSFQDAVATVRSLGLRYIWIDSLCIIQNSADDWKGESIQMCDIYAQAILTITSAHSSGAHGGMFVQRDGIRSMPFEITLDIKQKPMRLLYMPAGQREVSWQLSDLPLYSRAWCFQEMILSTRTLVFDPDGIKWECLKTAGSERMLEMNTMRHTQDIRTVQASLKQATSADFFDVLRQGDLTIQGSLWQSVVKDYASRNLTKYSDKLIAIAGVAQEAEKRTKNRYLAGLWYDHLFMNLVWYVHSSIGEDKRDHENRPLPGDLPYREADPVAPSWSWASINWRVTYDTFLQQERLCEVVGAEVWGTPQIQTGKITIHGDTRQLYVPSRTHPRNASLFKLPKDYRYTNEHKLSVPLFHVDHVMLATSEPPSFMARSQVMPVRWQPEDVWDEEKPITFLAIMRRPRLENNPLDMRRQVIHTLALVPTGNNDKEYRRIGLAMWEDCSWFGYQCAEDHGVKTDAWKKLGRSWNRVKAPILCEESSHSHPVEHSPLPLDIAYHSTAAMARQTITII